MVYSKNVPTVERVLRILVGSGLLGLALVGQSALGGPSRLIGVALAFSAVFVVLTGFVGWCPACAMVGRKLKANRRTE